MTSITANIASHLTVAAREEPHRIALYEPSKKKAEGRYTYTPYTYKKLEDLSNRIAGGLEAYGITKGTKTILMVPPSIAFFSLAFALFKVGAVPILIDPGMGVKNLKQCLRDASPEGFIGVPKAHLARLILGWERGRLKRLVTVGNKRIWGGTTLDAITSLGKDSNPESLSETAAHDMAAILFTSGSTGLPKGAVYTHANFTAQVGALKRTYHISGGDIDLCTFPLFSLFAPALNMVSIIPQMDFTRPARVDAKHIFDLIESFGVTNMFGSPALIRRISNAGLEQGQKLKTLKRVISAGAPVNAEILKTFSKMLSTDTEIFTPYGATEALPVCSIGSHEILGETADATDLGKGICIGKPLDSIDLSIIKITDAPIDQWHDELILQDGRIGEITVKGPQVTKFYVNGIKCERLNKITDSTAGQVYHRMGDLGYRDNRGRIWFCGRKSHRVITATETLFTIQVEAIFNVHKAVSRTALVGIPEGSCQKPVLIVEARSRLNGAERSKLRDELLEQASGHEMTTGIDTILFYKKFPVDIRHNAKINRELLAVWAEGRLS